ncbi:MAG: hypothetical protein M3N32_07975 [Actinomycetota bacterium]|nr:hypothetical protein [Actinomycetota bacterium]
MTTCREALEAAEAAARAAQHVEDHAPLHHERTLALATLSLAWSNLAEQLAVVGDELAIAEFRESLRQLERRDAEEDAGA